jgi:F-type H+-transporting ATPase subunit b
MIMNFLLANEAASGGGLSSLFTALGVNVQSLVLNTLAFLVVVAILAKWVYPALTKALDGKIAELETAARLEKEAKHSLELAQGEADKMLAEARKSAELVVSTSRDEAAEILEQTRAKAAAQADRIVAEAKDQLAKEVRDAQKKLESETIKLVAQATEAVLAAKLDDKQDAALIERSLEEARS